MSIFYMIDNRPKILYEAEYYDKLPKLPLTIDYSDLPTVLKIDLFSLFGIQPVTLSILNEMPSVTANPSKQEIEFYKKNDSRFQMLNVVANFHTIIVKGNIAYGKPYAISIVVGSKRGNIDERDIGFLSSLDLENITNQNFVYTDFNPFEGWYGGFFGDSNFLLGNSLGDNHIDSLGFTIETYFLNKNYNSEEVVYPGAEFHNNDVQEYYKKIRLKKYYKPFANIKPRKVWGADSPIELFLIQGLAQKNVFPNIQTSIYKDGNVYPTFYEMIQEGNYKNGTDFITEVDLFFPEKKIAVFCDSKKHHRSLKAIEKDHRIVNELEKIGIKSIRISGRDIINNLSEAVNRILKEIN